MTPAVRNKYSGRSRDSQSGTKTKDSKSAVGRPCWRKKAWAAPPWSGAKCNRPSRSIRSSHRTTRWQSPHSPSKNSTGPGRAIDGFMASGHIRRESGERKNKTPGIAGTTPRRLPAARINLRGPNYFTALVFFSGLASSRFGRVTVNPPFSSAALTLSAWPSPLMLTARATKPRPHRHLALGPTAALGNSVTPRAAQIGKLRRAHAGFAGKLCVRRSSKPALLLVPRLA